MLRKILFIGGFFRFFNELLRVLPELERQACIFAHGARFHYLRGMKDTFMSEFLFLHPPCSPRNRRRL